MTNRLTGFASSVLLYAALRSGLVPLRQRARPQPEIRTRTYEDACEDDAWLFADARPAFAAEVFQLDAAMSRAAGSLATLRGVLSRLSRHTLVLASEPSSPLPADIRHWPLEDADLFDEAVNFLPPVAQTARGAASVY